MRNDRRVLLVGVLVCSASAPAAARPQGRLDSVRAQVSAFGQQIGIPEHIANVIDACMPATAQGLKIAPAPGGRGVCLVQGSARLRTRTTRRGALCAVTGYAPETPNQCETAFEIRRGRHGASAMTCFVDSFVDSTTITGVLFGKDCAAFGASAGRTSARASGQAKRGFSLELVSAGSSGTAYCLSAHELQPSGEWQRTKAVRGQLAWEMPSGDAARRLQAIRADVLGQVLPALGRSE